MGANSPDLPTPQQAVKDVEKILKKAKEKPFKQTLRARLFEEEFRFGAPGEHAEVAIDAENYLRRVKKEGGEKGKEAPKYIPTLKETKRFAKKITDLRSVTELKLKTDQKTRIISPQKVNSSGESVIEKIIDLDEGFVTYTLDVGGEDNGRLQITEHRIVTSEYGAEETITDEDIIIDQNGIDIYINDDTSVGEVHRIFPNDPEKNEVDQNTPQAVQLTEALLNLYLKS